MPDWITHLGIGYLIAKLLKIKDIRLVLLGAILPDLARLAFISEIFNINTLTSFLLFEPLHTPFIVALIALTISLLNRKPKTAFLLILFGSSTHFLLDLLQKHIGYAEMLFYPINYSNLSLGLFWQESAVGITLTIVSAAILTYAVFEKKQYSKFKIKNLDYVIPLILIIIIMPLLTFNKIENSSYIKQLDNKQGLIKVTFAEVINENPTIIEEMGKRFEIIDNGLKKGEWITVKGIIDNGKIYPELIHKHTVFLKLHASFIGLLFFIIIWFYKGGR